VRTPASGLLLTERPGLDETRKLLAEVAGNGELIRIRRGGLEPASVADTGYVLDVSGDLLLMQRVTDRIDLDGYDVFRTADITTGEREFPHRQFLERAVALKALAPSSPGSIHLTNIRECLEDVQRRFPLVVIHREKVAPHECEIGRVRLTAGDLYALQWLSPDAIWEDDKELYRYADVTRVQFGNEYENTLALVAGLVTFPPTLEQR
jgi:hypothetical protein